MFGMMDYSIPFSCDNVFFPFVPYSPDQFGGNLDSGTAWCMGDSELNATLLSEEYGPNSKALTCRPA
jgi:hypothetical protein